MKYLFSLFLFIVIFFILSVVFLTKTKIVENYNYVYEYNHHWPSRCWERGYPCNKWRDYYLR